MKLEKVEQYLSHPIDQDGAIFRGMVGKRVDLAISGIVGALGIRVFIARSLLNSAGWLSGSSLTILRIRGVCRWGAREALLGKMHLKWERVLLDPENDRGRLRIQWRWWLRYCTSWWFTIPLDCFVTLWWKASWTLSHYIRRWLLCYKHRIRKLAIAGLCTRKHKANTIPYTKISIEKIAFSHVKYLTELTTPTLYVKCRRKYNFKKKA